MSIIKRTALAEEDLIETWLYIAEANQEAAGRLLDDFEGKFVFWHRTPNWEGFGLILRRSYVIFLLAIT